MAANCNTSSVIVSILNSRRFGAKVDIEDLKKFVYSYIQYLDCTPISINDSCFPYVGACNTLIENICNIVLPSFTFTQQTEGNNIDFIVNPNDINGQLPYSYVWQYNEQFFSLREGDKTSSTIKLLKNGADIPNIKFVSNVIVTITDAVGCSTNKTCQFTFNKSNGTSSGSLNCNEQTFVKCNPDYQIGINFTDITSTGFTLNWNYISGLPYFLTVNKVGELPIYEDYATSPKVFTGLDSNSTYTVRITTTCPNGSLLNQQVNQNTSNAGIATINCNGAIFSNPIFIIGTPYTGTLTVPYTNGNGGIYSATSFTSGGLTISTSSGTLNTGSGNIIFNVTGTPTTSPIVFQINMLSSPECRISVNAQPLCVQPSNIQYQIINFNSVTQTYTIKVSWNNIPGAQGYIIHDTNNMTAITVTNTQYTFNVLAGQTFNGTVQTICGPDNRSVETPITYAAAPPVCSLDDVTITNITQNSFNISGVVPALLPGETIFYQIFDPLSTLITQGTVSAFPIIITGLTPNTQYGVEITKNCALSNSFTIHRDATTLQEPDPSPTVYINLQYWPKIPLDGYNGNFCKTDGYSQDFNSEQIRINTFSDAACTIPLDVTGMGIVFHYNHLKQAFDLTCPSGTEVLTSSSNLPQTVPLSGTNTFAYCPSGNWMNYYQGSLNCGGGVCYQARHFVSIPVPQPSADYIFVAIL